MFGLHLHHASHANNPHLKVFEKNGKFGVGTDETNVPQFSFGTKQEADDYIRLANDYQAESDANKVAAAKATGSSASQAAPNEEPTQSTANAEHQSVK